MIDKQSPGWLHELSPPCHERASEVDSIWQSSLYWKVGFLLPPAVFQGVRFFVLKWKKCFDLLCSLEFQLSFDFKDISFVAFHATPKGAAVRTLKAFIWDFVLNSVQRAAALWSSTVSLPEPQRCDLWLTSFASVLVWDAVGRCLWRKITLIHSFFNNHPFHYRPCVLQQNPIKGKA